MKRTGPAGLPGAFLAWLGGQGARAVAALVFIGLAWPAAGQALRPFVGPAVFVLLCTAFLRIDPAGARAILKRPGLVLAATAWSMLAMPALVGGVFWLLPPGAISPDLFCALLLQAAASPMMASPALAAFLGLDATLVLFLLLAGSAAVPFVIPLFVALFLRPVRPFPPGNWGESCFSCWPAPPFWAFRPGVGWGRGPWPGRAPK